MHIDSDTLVNLLVVIATVLGAFWKLSSRLTRMETKLEFIERKICTD